jgi:hypothetical protein
MYQMGSISSNNKSIFHISILFLPCFTCLTYCQDFQGLSPLISPPLIPEILNFLDQRLALVYPIIQDFKNTITSDPLDITQTWVGADICNYKGFYCTSPPDNDSAITLASIDFNGFQLSAPTLDGFIDQLPDLALFHANSNKFSGTISPKITKLPFLYELDISNNNFFGSFPMEVLGIPALSFLDIRFNFFTGTVPPQVFTQRLDVLFLNNNNFMQGLPENLGSTPVLYLTLAYNKFIGPIPRSIIKASATLTEVLFSHNLLTGCLPYELGFLRKLVLFDASYNFLTGPLPCSLGCLAKLEQFNLASNLLYGQVPEVVCALGKLVNLSLSSNYFTKLGPKCTKLERSGVLDIRKNCIPDLPGQRSARECAAFSLHRRYCSNPASFNFIPCKVPSLSHPQIGTKRNLVGYSALLRQAVEFPGRN